MRIVKTERAESRDKVTYEVTVEFSANEGQSAVNLSDVAGDNTLTRKAGALVVEALRVLTK